MTTYDRLALGELNIQETEGAILPYIGSDFTTLDEYSQFKFGDGEVGTKYGSMLGRLVLDAGQQEALLGEKEVFIASSAYRVAPPASETLVAPFVDSANAAARDVSSKTNFQRFKIGKTKMATDNYAAMSFEERSKTIQNDLHLPEGMDLEGKKVVILDDIRVTGLREAALKLLLENAGVRHTSFYYILDAPRGRDYPQTEAVININAVKSIEDVLELAQRPGFVPNVRMCKFLLSQTVEAVAGFLASVPPSVADTILRYVDEDNLREVVKAIP